MLCLHPRVSLAMMPVEAARRHICESTGISSLSSYSFFKVDDPHFRGTFRPSFRFVYWFVKTLEAVRLGDHQSVLCVDTEPASAVLSGCCTLIGSYLILIERLSVEEAVAACARLLHRLPVADQTSSKDCWCALLTGKGLGWLSKWYSSPNSTLTEGLDMEEYLHYDDPENGGLHFIIPNRLLVFNCPSSLGEGLLWKDVDGKRLFDPAYYGELLPDFKIALVVRCCEENEYVDEFQSMHDIPVETINVNDGDLGRMLQRLDRFVTLIRAAPGAIALHGDRSGLGSAETLICSLLVRLFRFEAKAAEAWIRLLHPPSPEPWLRFVQDDGSEEAAASAPAPLEPQDALPNLSSTPLPPLCDEEVPTPGLISEMEARRLRMRRAMRQSQSFTITAPRPAEMALSGAPLRYRSTEEPISVGAAQRWISMPNLPTRTASGCTNNDQPTMEWACSAGAAWLRELDRAPDGSRRRSEGAVCPGGVSLAPGGLGERLSIAPPPPPPRMLTGQHPGGERPAQHPGGERPAQHPEGERPARTWTGRETVPGGVRLTEIPALQQPSVITTACSKHFFQIPPGLFMESLICRPLLKYPLISLHAGPPSGWARPQRVPACSSVFQRVPACPSLFQRVPDVENQLRVPPLTLRRAETGSSAQRLRGE